MLEVLPRSIGRALRSARAGTVMLALHAEPPPILPTIELWSDAFDAGGPLPVRFTADGAKLSPPLAFRGVPREARSLVLLVEDADSPSWEPLVHAIAWNIPARDGTLAEGALSAPGATLQLGRNSLLRCAYLPPDPPPGHGLHHYVFQLFALDRSLHFARAPGRRALLSAMRGHLVGRGSVTGTYRRPS
jgi:Raf kinase inhibitor-like YbhB/YbcL family protein